MRMPSVCFIQLVNCATYMLSLSNILHLMLSSFSLHMIKAPLENYTTKRHFLIRIVKIRNDQQALQWNGDQHV